ncbi:MAG TPA: SDR family oxidoreductase [Gemmatimonadales bacterium]|nr:SDR family oxidoreductase [Gemmatimonadales bacterium]
MTDTINPVALITGGSVGIGRAIAFTLGRAGWRVAICARSPEPIEVTLADLRAAGITAMGGTADVGVPSEIERVIGQVEQELGPITTLVNNAGVLIGKRIEELSLEEWDATMATNLRSLFVACRRVLPGMRERGVGDIVNIASLAGKNGIIGGTAYAASKHAVLGFSKSLMLETRKDGIRVIAICPGSVDTAMMRDPAVRGAPAKQRLDPQDVADAVLATLRLPRGAMLSELDIRPSNP